MRRCCLLLIAVSLMACAPAEEPADLVLVNGRFATIYAASPTAEAVASRGQKLVVVGTNAEAESLIGPETEVIDLGGAFAAPGPELVLDDTGGQTGDYHAPRDALETALSLLVETDLTLRSASTAPQMAVMERTLIRLAMLQNRGRRG